MLDVKRNSNLTTHIHQLRICPEITSLIAACNLSRGRENGSSKNRSRIEIRRGFLLFSFSRDRPKGE